MAAKAPLIIKKCTCEHEYQDGKYGKGNRLHNPSGKKDGPDRCSVCYSPGRPGMVVGKKGLISPRARA